MTLESETPRSEGVQYVTGDEQKAITNSSRKNEAAGPKEKGSSVVGVSAGESLMLETTVLHKNLEC